MRSLLLILIALGLSACSAIGYHRLPGPPIAADAATPPPDAPRAILVVVDGLRADVLEAYVRVLKENDYEPSWPSGLALLGRERFRLATAPRAEAPLPGVGLAADAALVTGHTADRSGVPGSVFYERGPDGDLLRYDFTAAPDAARIYFAPGFTLPDAARRPLLETLLQTPTLYERLPPGRTAVVAFHLFGRGATWLVPQRSGDGINAIMQHEISSWAVPLFDRGVRNAAIDALVDAAPPHLLTVYFRGVSAESCFQAERQCQGRADPLAVVQRGGLQAVDAHLFRMLQALRAAHPEALAHTTLLLVGSGGLAERRLDATTAGQRRLAPPAVFERLANAAKPACGAWMRAAVAGGDLVLAPEGGTAHVYLRRGPAGQRARHPWRLDCIGGALDALLAEDAGGEDGWLAGAAWLPGDASMASPFERARIALRPDFADTLSASRRARIRAKLRRAFDARALARSGDAILFAQSPWIFIDPWSVRPPATAAAGGLEDAAIGSAFLVADRGISDVAVRSLAAASVELTDVAPTVLALLGVAPEALAALPRSPLFERRDGVLTWVQADRQVKPPPTAAGRRWIWQEGPEGLSFGLEEPQSRWPPDSFGVRLGAQRFDWNPEKGAFPAGSPCRYREGDGRREWRCTLPLDRSAPALTIAAARRAPSGDEGDEDGPPNADFLEPVILGDEAPTASTVRVICAGPDALRLHLEAEDALGLDRVEVLLADRDGLGLPDRRPAGLRAAASLGGLAVATECQGDPLGAACAVTAGQARWAGPVEVPFSAALRSHHRQATRLLSVHPGDEESLQKRFGATAADVPPRLSYLAVRICNVAGRCVQRPLISDRDYVQRVEAGCP